MNNANPFSGFKTRQQIATEYGITVKTLKRHLGKKDFTLPKGHRVSLGEQKDIYEALGYPPNVSKMEYEGI